MTVTLILLACSLFFYPKASKETAAFEKTRSNSRHDLQQEKSRLERLRSIIGRYDAGAEIGAANEKAQLELIYDLKEVARQNGAIIQYVRVAGNANLAGRPAGDKRFPGIHSIPYEIAVSVGDYHGLEALIGTMKKHPFLISEMNVFYPSVTFKGALYGR